MRIGRGIWIALVLLVSCGDKSRGRCELVADHIADLIVADLVAHPDQLWDAVHDETGDPGIPATYAKDTFKAFLASPDGQAWILRRRTLAKQGTHRTIDQCAAHATQGQIDCLLAATTRQAVAVCDTVK